MSLAHIDSPPTLVEKASFALAHRSLLWIRILVPFVGRTYKAQCFLGSLPLSMTKSKAAKQDQPYPLIVQILKIPRSKSRPKSLS